MSMKYQGGINLPGYNPLKVADAPTIGTATAGTSLCASVTFTAPSCVGGGAISSYTVFSDCGTKTASGSSSPLVVTGLSAGAHTFKVIATNAYGPSYPSAASNSITATAVTCATYTTAGTYSWVAPSGVTSVAVVAIGAGGTGTYGSYRGGGGGGLGYKNGYSVTPGNSYTVVVGAPCTSRFQSFGGQGGSSYFSATCVVRGVGGYSNGGTYTGDGGGNGGNGGCSVGAGGGGAGGYSGNGGLGGNDTGGYAGSAGAACSGAGGGGGGGGAIRGCLNKYGGGAGGGVGIYGKGSTGAGGAANTGGGAGSSGVAGGNATSSGGDGGLYGGGGGSGGRYYGCCGYFYAAGIGVKGAVRIVWCVGGIRGTPSFPSTNVGA